MKTLAEAVTAFLQASAGAVGLLADIRESIADKSTSVVAKPKEIEPDGQT